MEYEFFMVTEVLVLHETIAISVRPYAHNEQRWKPVSERKKPRCPLGSHQPANSSVPWPGTTVHGFACPGLPTLSYFPDNSDTMAIRALIVDDEADARHNLQLMLEEQCPNVEVVGMAATADEARKLIGTMDPQALFLDIKMPGEDGFSLLRSLPEPHLPVVFTTAYDEFALRAFKENALDYLEKPIDPEELDRAVGKLERTVGDPGETKRRSEGLHALMNDPASPLSTRVAVPSRDGLVLLRHEDILYLEASDSYTVVHVRDGKRTISSKHIRVFETNLDPKKFFRVHKSYIINLEHLRSFSRSEGNMAVLDNGALVPVSRRRLPDLLAMINTF